MTYILRDYQEDSADAAMEWVRKSIDPCLIEAATGAGKSLIVAEIAKRMHKASGGKHVLCLAPSAELVTQNREKYLLTGEPASVYSASAGGKCLKHPVVFGTPGTVKNAATRMGPRFCAVIVDECHGITPTIKKIIDDMRQGNPNLRVIGLSATPYRLNEGYIYRMDERGKPMAQIKDPYFTARVYNIQARTLIDRGFLTEPHVGSTNGEHYDTHHLELNSMGKFKDEERAYVGHGRKTAAIVADIIEHARSRQGVMIFAATVQHAKEVLASLPPSMSAIVTGDTPKAERDRIVRQFKSREIKYLVNVSVLTTGFDAPHVDLVALLRLTESVSLLQQMIGRGLRIAPGKNDCLILDYAENLTRHCPDGDLFRPEIRAAFTKEKGTPLKCECPDCGTENEFSMRPNDEGYDIDLNGYYVDLDGNRVETDLGPVPAHFGRRCQGLHLIRGGSFVQCGYRWTLKHCPHCDAENDIAARYCSTCKGEIVDPAEKLKIEYRALRRDPTRLQTDIVISWTSRPVSTAKSECIRVDYVTAHRTFSIWYHPLATKGARMAEFVQFMEATKGGNEQPQTVTYRKDPESGFYRIYGYNREPERETA